MIFERFVVEGLAHNSYLLGSESTRTAVVIDPRRDVDVYMAAARQRGLTITHTIDTHVHADYVSGAHELGALGCTAMAGPGSGLGFAHVEARDDERLTVGDLEVRFLHTPGHTPEHISILVSAAGQPSRVFTGDALFVGAVGRPDLLGASKAGGLAAQLYESLFGKLLALPDEIEVHPAHGAGSLCGTGIGTEPSSTIGAERRFNPWLRPRTREEFVAAVLGDLPETPAYFFRMKKLNQAGADLIGLAPVVPRAIAPDAAAARMRDGAILVDLRDATGFGAGHPAGAINIGFGARLGYWAGWVLPPDAPLILLPADPHQTGEAVRQLLRVGLDRVNAVIDGGFTAWESAGLPVASIPQLAPADFRARRARGERIDVLDVRTPAEWRHGHLDGARHVPLGDVPARLGEIVSQGAPIATLCEGGYRSSLAASLLLRAGIGPVVNLTGGMSALRDR